MPGLQLGGTVRGSLGTGYQTSSAPATATQAAFGPGYGSNNMPSNGNALAPNDPFGVSLWSAVTAAIILLVIRHSLPA